ncbi:MAG: D-alanyl-D-alanine carboxypeptidase/D-alanyl-D-alanine-endopeptidase [Pyrinomonadaceae bacterium]
MLKQRSNQYLVLAVLTFALLFSVRLLGRQTKNNEPSSKAPSSPTAKPETVKDPSSTKQIADPALAELIDRALNQSDVRTASWGVFVMSLNDGGVLYSRDADKPFTPASNMKVYTTAVALDLLGADYRWRTSVYANKQPDANGVVEGDLTLYGRGAPDLISKSKGDAPSLAKLADRLYQAGVREIRGGIIGDNSYFRGDLFGAGWQWNDLQWYFGAEPSALSIDENSVEVTIAPGKPGSNATVVVNPAGSPIHLANSTTTAARDAKASIGIARELSGNDLRVWGDFPIDGHAFSAFLSVHDPALWAATLFKQALSARGIKVNGEVHTRDFRVNNTDKFDPQKAIELAFEDSETLGRIVHQTNKESNNLFAELILRTIGKERGAPEADDQRKNRVRGDDEAGTVLVRTWLESKGIDTRPLAIRDGSGLSRLDLVTPESTARLLAAIANTGSANVFHDSLPIAGRDGTLSSRLNKVTGRIFAKTGTLTYTHSLSGYATTPNNGTLVFSIMCNDSTLDRAALRAIDEIATALADFRPFATVK